MSTAKTRTITLTDRAPVKIQDDEWPVIAHGSYSDFDNGYEFQANRTWKLSIRVRRHADGRAIVYGVYDYSTAFQGERGFAARAGKLLSAGDDIVGAIRTVGRTIAEEAEGAGHEFGAHVAVAVRECIADLPAEPI